MRRGLLHLAAIALLVAGGCGLTENDSPQAIAPENLPPNLLEPDPGTSTTIPEAGETVAVTVYLLVREGDTTRLSPVEREVVDPAAPGELLTSLLSTPSEAELETGVSTSIPTDTVLLSTELDEDSGELVIDISDELLAIQGTELANAFAQLVYTATEVEGVRQVRFLVEGEEVQAPDAEGAPVSGAVRRADYAALAPQS
ncbi:MAG: GerMN domain-containing protein [Acidimicrobiales bacterium]